MFENVYKNPTHDDNYIQNLRRRNENKSTHPVRRWIIINRAQIAEVKQSNPYDYMFQYRSP